MGAFLRHSDGGKDTSHITKKEGQIAIQLGKGTITALFPLQLDYLKELNNKEDCTEVTLGILKKKKKIPETTSRPILYHLPLPPEHGYRPSGRIHHPNPPAKNPA